MKTSKIKSKLDDILGISAKENETEKPLAAINALLEKLNKKKFKLEIRLKDETDSSNIDKLEQKLKLIKRQIEKATTYKSELEG